MFVRGLFLDYQVVWRSTFIHDPATVASLLGALLAPGAFALGEALPDADAVRPMMTGEGVAAAPWIAVYAASAAMVILAPRALLAAWEALRIRSRRSRLSLDLGSCYYQKVIGKAREVRVGQIQETIRADVRLGSARFAEGIASFVEARLFDEKIVPHLARFREEGGRIEDLEQAIARECRGFEPALGRHLDLSRAEFERSLAASVAESVGGGVALSLPAEGSLSDDVGAASRGSSASVGEAIGAGVQRTLGYSVTATLGLLVGTLSGGFGHHLGAAIVVALLGTTGPIGFLVGALVGIAVAGGAWFAGREKAAGAIKHLALPGPVVRALLSESRLERMLTDARHKCHASVEGLIKQRLEGLLPEIAEQIWRKVKPALGEQQRVRASER
jgi:hypothetical protein